MDDLQKEVPIADPHSNPYKGKAMWVVILLLCVTIILAATIIGVAKCPQCEEPENCTIEPQLCEPEILTLLKYQCIDGTVVGNVDDCTKPVVEDEAPELPTVTLAIINSGDQETYINNPELRIENLGELVSNLQFDIALWRDDVLIEEHKKVVFRAGSVYIDSLGPNQVRRAMLDITIPDVDYPRLSAGEYRMVVELRQGDQRTLINSAQYTVQIRS